MGARVGRYVKYQRRKRRWSLQNLARKTSLTPSFLTRLESGKYKDISFGAMEQLANGFDVPFVVFLKKCGIAEDAFVSLPDFEFYLREKFQMPTEAVEDMKLFLEFMMKKYRKEIACLKTKHIQYWKSKA